MKTLPSLPGFVPNQHVDESALAPPAAPYAPPTRRPLGPGHKLSPRSNRDLPASTVQAQSLEIVRGAIDRMSQGFFMHVADLSQYMQRDSTFSAAMEKRVLGLLRNDMRFVPASSSDLDKRVAAAVERFWPRMATEVELRLWVQWFHLLSIGIASVDWSVEIDGDGRCWKVPTLRTRNMRWFYWDVSRSSLIDTSNNGVSTVDDAAGRYVVANAWRYGMFGGKACQLGEDWIEKVFARRDWAEWSDFNSWPIFKAIVPSGGLEDGNISGAFVEGLQQNARNRTVCVEKGTDGNNTYDFETVPVGGSEWQGYPARIAMLDRKIQVSWLGGNLSSEVADQGARAAAGTQQSAETRLIQSDAVLLSQVLRDQLVRFFVTENFGRRVAVPDVGWEVGVEEDILSRGRALQTFATFLKDMPTGYDIDNIQELGQLFGIQLRKAAAQPPAAPTNDPAEDDSGTPSKNARCPEDMHQVHPGRKATLGQRSVKKIGHLKWRAYDGDRNVIGTFTSLKDAQLAASSHT